TLFHSFPTRRSSDLFLRKRLPPPRRPQNEQAALLHNPLGATSRVPRGRRYSPSCGMCVSATLSIVLVRTRAKRDLMTEWQKRTRSEEHTSELQSRGH